MKTFKAINNISTIRDILQKNNTVLTKILKKNQDNIALSAIFNSIIDPDMAKNCKFAGIEHSTNTTTTHITLHIVVKNAAWATRIRYNLPELLKNLKTQPEFKDITDIRYSVNRFHPAKAVATKTGNFHKISKENENLWRRTIELLKKQKDFSSEQY